MAIVINGSGTVTGISVGGLPDGIVDAGTLATNSVDSAELIDGAVDDSHLADGAGEITDLSIWLMTTGFSNGGTVSDTTLSSNLIEAPDAFGYVKLGSSMTQSSGIFTFPSTGYWEVMGRMSLKQNSGTSKGSFGISTTLNNGTNWSWTSGNDYWTHTGGGTNSYENSNPVTYVKVTDTAQVKVRFQYNTEVFSGDDVTVDGRSTLSDGGTQMMFIKLRSL